MDKLRSLVRDAPITALVITALVGPTVLGALYAAGVWAYGKLTGVETTLTGQLSSALGGGATSATTPTTT
jgi:hypothetical protein